MRASSTRISPTGATVILTDGTDRAILTAIGATAALDVGAVPGGLVDRARHLHSGGYYLYGPATRAGLAGLFETARASGVTTSLDTNWDPDEAWDGGVLELLRNADVFLPNAAEVRRIARNDDAEAAARSLAAIAGEGRTDGGPIIVVKQGATGAFAVTVAGEVVRVPALSRRDARCDGCRRRLRSRVPACLAGRRQPARVARARGGLRRPVDARRRRRGRTAHAFRGTAGPRFVEPGVTATMTASAAGRLLFVAANPSIDRLYEVDRLAIGGIHRPLAEVAVPGGKGLNAARAAATLGGSVTVVGIVAGRAGEWIVDGLATLGIEARMARGMGETRTCVSILDRASGRLTEVYPRGSHIEAATWAAFESVVRTELANGVAVIALSGSLPPGAPSDGYARIARMAADQVPAVPVLADTAGDALAALLEQRPALVKVNAGEAADATNIVVTDASSAADAATALRRDGAGVAIVTLGVSGAVVVTETERVRLMPPDATGSYPTGSGDAFLGGLAIAWSKGEQMVEAARLGMAAGIANAQLPGAGNLDPGRIDGLVAAITLDAL